MKRGKCPKCGQVITIDENAAQAVCAACGATLKLAQKTSAPSPVPPPAPVAQPPAPPSAQFVLPPTYGRAPSKKSKTSKGKVIAIVGASVVAVVLVAAVISNSGNPKYASDDAIIKAVVGEKEIDYYHKLKDADYTAYRHDVDLYRQEIIMSGKTCEEYAVTVQSRKKAEADQSKKVDRQEKVDDMVAKFRAKVEADVRDGEVALRKENDNERKTWWAEWKRLHDEGDAIVLSRYSGEERDRQQEKKNQLAAKAKEAEDKERELSAAGERKDLNAKIEKLRKEAEAKIEAYRAQAEKEVPPTN